MEKCRTYLVIGFNEAVVTTNTLLLVSEDYDEALKVKDQEQNNFETVELMTWDWNNKNLI